MPLEALRRELQEELGVSVSNAVPVCFASHAHFVLLLFACKVWTGNPKGSERQSITWIDSSELENHAMWPLDGALVPPLRELMMGL